MPCTALIVVLGDLGRSPRMANHARALLARGWTVTLAGYAENALPPDLRDCPAVRVLALQPGPPALIRLVLAAQAQPWSIILIQNPPGFPAVAAAALARRPGTRLVLDWHNLGGTLLALRPTGRRRWAAAYSWCERLFARLADDHWSVSAALADAVRGGAAIVVYDQPARSFCAAAAITPEDRRDWWHRVLPDEPLPEAGLWVAAPSSWGPDEDHGAMLRAAQHWKHRWQEWTETPQVTIIATGKGAGQAEFAGFASAFDGGAVTLQTAWIPAEEYPAFLRHADLGLCLHRSSSGLDLPMKLADFRGAGLPSLVFDYGPVLAEILPDPAADERFQGDHELAAALRRFAESGPRPGRPPLGGTSWEDEWGSKLGAWARERENPRPVI